MAQGDVGRIAGTVYNTNDEPLLGITVMLEGTNKGVATDALGNYEFLSIMPGRYTLVFSGIGYTKQIRVIVIETRKTVLLDIKLEENTQQLEEVTVHGKYDSQLM
jgi:iron complex outermembrane receptor protein